MVKPTFICIGGQRCGTTRLHRILDEHPDIRMTHNGEGFFKKEIHYFDRFVLTNSLNWYESHFSPDFVTGEITPGYSTLNIKTVRLIKQYLPEIKIIFIVRKPLDRIWSQIRMMRSRWGRYKSGDLDLFKLVRLFDSPALQLRSNYLQTFSIWNSVFGPGSIFTTSFDNLLLPDGKGLLDLFEFLGVSTSWTPSFDASKKVLSSPEDIMPYELSWLISHHWLPMLEEIEEFIPSVGPWIEEMKIESELIPEEFLVRLAEIRLIQKALHQKTWMQHQQNQLEIICALEKRIAESKNQYP